MSARSIGRPSSALGFSADGGTVLVGHVTGALRAHPLDAKAALREPARSDAAEILVVVHEQQINVAGLSHKTALSKRDVYRSSIETGNFSRDGN